MIKLLALDLDGTIVNDALEISDATLAALSKVQREAGVKVVIATGRMFPSTLPFARRLGTLAPIICYQGGMIRDVNQSVFHLDDHNEPDLTQYPVRFHQPIALDVAQAVAHLAAEQNLHINLYVNDTLHTTHFNPDSLYYQKISGVKPVHTPHAPDALTAAPTKLMIIDDQCDRIVDELKQAYVNQISVCKSRHNFCEIVDARVSKWTAIEQLIQDWGLAADEVMAIGDQENDLSMITHAGLGVAMGNAPDHVKAVAKFVTRSIDEDGVVHAINTLIHAA